MLFTCFTDACCTACLENKPCLTVLCDDKCKFYVCENCSEKMESKCFYCRKEIKELIF